MDPAAGQRHYRRGNEDLGDRCLMMEIIAAVLVVFHYRLPVSCRMVEIVL